MFKIFSKVNTSCRHSVLKNLTKDRPRFVVAVHSRVYFIRIGKPEGKKKCGTPRRRWEYNIKMTLNI